MRSGLLFVVTAPSGAGKTTLCRGLLKKFSDLAYSVSCTTRPPRPGERTGKDYTFMKEETFRSLIRKRAFLEWARVHGAYYGTLRKNVEKILRRGKNVLLDVDVQGARNVRKIFRESVLIFVSPPSMRALKKRLLKRHQDSPEVIRIRLRNALREMRAAGEFDYNVVNDKLNEAFENICGIYRAERCRIRQN
ncbi:MAG TPA: guanylate kinase [bacterium]|nr:guanylate kinase [bacterium]